MDIAYKIKTATEEDINNHLCECKAFFNPHLNKIVNINEYSKKLAKRSVTFEAWAGKFLVGLVAAYFNDTENKSGYITNVSLVKKIMGKGAASELVKMCVDYARQYNFQKIKLEVYRNNKQAIRLYKKYGFIAFEKKDDFILMRLEL